MPDSETKQWGPWDVLAFALLVLLLTSPCIMIVLLAWIQR